MNPLRVLLVKDVDSPAGVVEALLRAAGPSAISQIEVSSGFQQTDAILRQEQTDVAVFSLRNPLDLVTILSRSFLTLPIVVVAADAKALQSSADAIAFGAQDLLLLENLSAEALFRALHHAVERQRLTGQLRQQIEELKQFAHLVAHEIKNPLQPVTTALYILDEYNKSDTRDPIKRVLSSARESTRHLTQLVNELLSFAESEPDPVNFVQADMNKLADEAIGRIAPGEGVGFHPVREELPDAIGAETPLMQVLHNLIGGALRYRLPEDGRITVRVGARDVTAQSATYFVEDNGKSLSPEVLACVFEPFSRVATQSGLIGSGVGLSFCRRVIERHGGVIWVESCQPHGTRFLFTLPRVRVS